MLRNFPEAMIVLLFGSGGTSVLLFKFAELITLFLIKRKNYIQNFEFLWILLRTVPNSQKILCDKSLEIFNKM
ncbi:hypothetical protein LEP1GSC172_2365 [Leptospira noguchii]|uniref:Uncharacterized protein n=1 Tax=Leptospira noguchii TaxID=28182 RepID=M6VPQ2_9LEPT|nr:hypothetical protein LEP1GSC172_2365 [Leptospira noguchii]